MFTERTLLAVRLMYAYLLPNPLDATRKRLDLRPPDMQQLAAVAIAQGRSFESQLPALRGLKDIRKLCCKV